MLERINTYRQLIAGAAAVLAVYIYGVAYFAVSAFFRPFGISPSDAGVTQSTLVARALSGLALVFGVFAVGGLAGAIAYHWLRSANSKVGCRRRRVVIVSLSTASLAFGAFMVARDVFVVGMLLGAIGAGGFYPGVLTEFDAKRERPHRAVVLLGPILVAALAWAFLFEATAASERLAQKVMRDGDFRDLSAWEWTTSLMLGVDPVPVEAKGDRCSVLVAHAGDYGWVLTSPGETVEVHRVSRNELTVRYAVPQDPSAEPRRRACW